MSSTSIFQQYKHPPIVEAVIGVVFDSNVETETVDKIQKKLKKYYSNIQTIRQLKVPISPPLTAEQSRGVIDEEIGRRRSTSDQTEIVIVQKNSITISQLAPYTGWDTFFKRFKRDWSIIKRSLGFRPIKQIGVRYINRIDIPFEGVGVRIADYLKALPNIPDQFGTLSGYSVSAEVQMPDSHCILRLNSGAVPSPLPNCVSVVLDLDLIRNQEVPQSDEEIFATLESMRARKNAFFEATLTEKTRELFNNEST